MEKFKSDYSFIELSAELINSALGGMIDQSGSMATNEDDVEIGMP